MYNRMMPTKMFIMNLLQAKALKLFRYLQVLPR